MKTQRPTPAEIQAALYRRPGKSRLDLETQLVQSVLERLGVMGIRGYRRNVGAREWLDASGRQRLVRFNEPGMSDVWAIAPWGGVHLEVELKVPGKMPTPSQDAWLVAVRQAGAIGLCVTSVEELVRELRREFHARGWPWDARWNL